jgi:hypothetical protein
VGRSEGGEAGACRQEKRSEQSCLAATPLERLPPVWPCQVEPVNEVPGGRRFPGNLTAEQPNFPFARHSPRSAALPPNRCLPGSLLVPQRDHGVYAGRPPGGCIAR